MKKNASIFNLLLSATICLLLFGCKKGLIEKQGDPLSITGKQILSVPDVYVAGSEGGQAKYWKNGVGVTLPGGTAANGIVVVGTDVHVCGYGVNPSTFNLVALYWKNGVLTTLSDGTNHVLASGIAVSGTDVYVSGKVGFFANTGLYWKNGIETSLGAGEPNGVFAAANGDIYIANGEWGNPSYWKNGTLVTLTGPSGAYVRAVAVNGSDVFVVGTNSSGPTETALYWKNGVPQFLLNPSKTNAMAVAVNSFNQAIISGTSGSDLNNMHISYWDGIGDLHILSSGKYVAASTGIAVDQTTDDIYVCGSEFNGQSPPAMAKYWTISGGSVTSVTLNSGSSDATALAITLGW
jgi:hypothetical protein